MDRFKNSTRGFLASCLIVLTVMCLISCGSFGSKKPSQENLTVAVEGFNAALHWEDYKVAYTCLSPPLQEKFWELADKLHATLRFMDAQVRSVNLNEEKQSATLQISYRFYYLHNPSLQNRTLQMRLQFDEKDKMWRIVHHELKELLKEKI